MAEPAAGDGDETRLSAMTEIKFDARVKATGLRPRSDDMPMLEALVRDLDRAAAMLRGPRYYADEPLSVFQLTAT